MSLFDESNVVGLDASLAKKNIDDFKDKSFSCLEEARGIFKFLFDELSYLWASEKAIAFYDNYNNQLIAMFAEINQEIRVICQNAVRAYNIMADANGESRIENSYYEIGIGEPAYEDFCQLSSNINGVAGMNVILIKNVLLPAVQSKIATLYANINGIPKSIALYDTESSQSGAFDVSASGIQFMISEKIDEIISAINLYLETEQNN